MTKNDTMIKKLLSDIWVAHEIGDFIEAKGTDGYLFKGEDHNGDPNTYFIYPDSKGNLQWNCSMYEPQKYYKITSEQPITPMSKEHVFFAIFKGNVGINKYKNSIDRLLLCTEEVYKLFASKYYE